MAYDAFINFFRAGSPLALSHFFAQLMGLFLIILALYVFFKHEHFREALESVEKNPALQFWWSAPTIFLGLFLVLTHNLWVADWPVLMTIVGWFLLIVGLLELFFPETILKGALRLFEGPTSYFAAAIWLIIGILLTLWGFRGP